MKKITYIKILLLLSAGALFTACKKDFLNTEPTEQVPSSITWTDPAFAQAFIHGLYEGLYEGGFDEQMLACLTDEAIFTHAGRGINTVNEGTLNPSNEGWVNRQPVGLTCMILFAMQTWRWKVYRQLLSIMLALKERLEGETRFLRAYYYHQLLRFYGGVPIITKIYGLNEDYKVARNTYAEVSAFIIKEADAAYLLIKRQRQG